MAKNWIIKFSTLLLAAALIAGAVGWDSARAEANYQSPINQPTYGTADVDGSTGEWRDADKFAPLYKSSNPKRSKLAWSYLRYDCNTKTMYVLVLSNDGKRVEADGAEAWVKLNGSKKVDGNSGDNGTPPDFRWVTQSGKTIGFEASFFMEPGTYDSKLAIHVNVYDGYEWQTAGNNSISVLISCQGGDKKYDWGDLPASFNATLAEDDGARHQIGDLYLGATIDGEANGVESSSALGDDLANTDDEDGVELESQDQWKPGQKVNLHVTVTGTGGYLKAWFDWDGNGSFSDNELVDFGNVQNGLNVLQVTVPARYVQGRDLYARFRLFHVNDLTPECDDDYRGKVYNGEVEDYKWSFQPTAVNLSAFKASTGEPLSAGWAFPLGAVFLLGLVVIGKKFRT